MKKTLLLICLLLTSLTSMLAQNNLTLNKEVSPLGGLIPTSAYTEKTGAVTAVSKDNLQNLTKDNDDLAILLPQPTGNWKDTDVASQQPVQGFFIDFGESKTVGSLSIEWETGDVSAKNFKVYLSATAPSSEGNGQDVTIPDGAVEIFSIDNNNSQKNTQSYTGEEQKSGRYVIFKADKGANQVYGIKMRRFFVYDNETPTLTSLTLASSRTYTKLETAYDLTLAGFDKVSNSFDISGKTPVYTILPEGSGSVSEGKFTASKTGEITISAKIDGVTSNTITVYGVSSENLITSTDQFVDMSEGVLAAVEGLFDGNEESPDWVILSSSTEGGACDVSFTVNLKNKYDIDMVAVAFEGARAGAYTISFSEDNSSWREAYSVAARTGIEASKDRFMGTEADNTKVQYIKFHFTTAATGYGIKVREVSVFGTEYTVPTAISLSASASDFVVGKSVNLTVKRENENTISTNTVDFTSSNDAIATVDANGVVTGVAPGNVTITATLKENNSISNTIDLTVNPKPEGQELTVDGISIILQPYHYTGTEGGSPVDYYQLKIFSDNVMTGLPDGSYWHINSDEGVSMNNTESGRTYEVAADGHTITITVTSSTDPAPYNNFYVQFNSEGEKIFGTDIPLNWIDIVVGEIPEVPTTGDKTNTISDAGVNNGKTLKYTYEFTQTGAGEVTVSFECTNPDEIDALVVNGFFGVSGGTETVDAAGKHFYTWVGQKRGKKLTAAFNWAYTDGTFTTPLETYIVRDPLTIAETTGTATITGELRPANVGDINNLAAENSKIDVTGLTIKQAAAIVPANNPNAVVVATSTQATDLAGTKNLVIYDGVSAYTADDIDYTDLPGTVPANLSIQTSDVTYTRKNIANDKMVSVALPFAAEIPEGFKAYQLTSYDSGLKTITFDEVASLSAGVAYIVVNKSGDAKDFVATKNTAITLNFTEKETDITTAKTTANLTQNLDNSGDKYVLSDNKIKKLGSSAKVAAFRGYFTFETAPSRDLDVTLEDGLSSGINNLKDGAIKEVIFYDLNGHRVDNPTKGLYIVNGKKVIIK
ncbi:MAG: discoidin domain-containing protein [Prevotella sp.]|nr:discoidin domain-containing protein [Prevotella sp.]